ncbi:MAG: hypothetical protein L3K17_05080 [Thermoplasmata archaeon]|nr:hypothetical protein [Thermoplasmata archaeon]
MPDLPPQRRTLLPGTERVVLFVSSTVAELSKIVTGIADALTDTIGV